MLLWNSRERVRALRTQNPATRSAFGRSFGPMKMSATTPISSNSDQPRSKSIGSRPTSHDTPQPGRGSPRHADRRYIAAEGEGVGHVADRFETAAGAAHDDRAIAKDSTEDRLVDIDALDLGAVHFERVPAQQSGLVDDAIVGDGE